MSFFLLQNLAPWDTPYYTKKVKRDWLQVGSSEFSPYFSLGTCMEGLNNLMNNLYNISLINDELAPGEIWAPDVYKLAGIRILFPFKKNWTVSAPIIYKILPSRCLWSPFQLFIVQKKSGLPPSLLGNNLKFIIQVLWFVHNHCPCISLA
jgi:hypothetical protein